MNVRTLGGAQFTAVLFCVFVLPYLVPAKTNMISASSLVGFNNSVAYFSYVVLIAGFAFLVRRSVSGTPLIASARGPLFPAPSRAVVAIMAGHVLLFAAMYFKLHGFVLAEGLYFQDAAYRAIGGMLPYVDFSFFYGPLMLYPTVFMARVVGLLAGYAVYYVALYLFGLYVLYALIAALVPGARHQTLWFAVFAIGFFNPILGLNYTLGRFLLPPFTLLAAWRALDERTRRSWLTAAALVALTILYSPDMGVVVIGALGVLGLVGAWLRPDGASALARVAAIGGAGVAVAVVLMLLIDGTFKPLDEYVRTVVTFSAGGWNTQIDPSLPMLTLLLWTTATITALCGLKWKQSPADVSIAVAYAALALLMQRGCFGKADVEHIAFSGLPVYLAAAGAASRITPSARPYRLALLQIVVGVVLPLQWYHGMLFWPTLAQRMPVASAATTMPEAKAVRPASKQEIQASLAAAVRHFGDDRVYYMHKLEYYRLPVYLEYRLKPFMYYPVLGTAFSSRDIDAMIDSLRKTNAIVLSRKADLNWHEPSPLPTSWPYFVTSSPLPGSRVFNLTREFQSQLEKPLDDFLTSAYERRFEQGEIVGLVRRDLVAASTRAFQ